MNLPHDGSQVKIFVSQLSEHVLRFDIIRIVVLDTLSPRYLSDGSQRCRGDLSGTLSNWVGHCESLFALLVEHR